MKRNSITAISIVTMLFLTGCTLFETDRSMHIAYSSAKYGFPVRVECHDDIEIPAVVEHNRYGLIQSPSFYSEDCVLVCKAKHAVPLDGIRYKTIYLNYCWQESFLYALQGNANVIFLFAPNGSFLGLKKPDWADSSGAAEFPPLLRCLKKPDWADSSGETGRGDETDMRFLR